MTHTQSLALLASVVVPACIFGPGASCGPPPRALVNTNFERGCTGTCGLVVEQGSADVTTALHPGEHVLHVAPGSRVATSWFMAVRPGAEDFSLIARCTGGGTLHIAEHQRPGCGAAGPERANALFANVSGDDWRTWGPDGDSTVDLTGNAVVDVRLVLESGATGDCFIDNLVFRTGALFFDERDLTRCAAADDASLDGP